MVCAGTCVENLDFGGTDARLMSRDGAAATIIDGDAADTVVTFANGESSDALLEGFTLTNGNGRTGSSTEDYTGGGVDIHDSSPTIRGNILTGNVSVLGGGISVYGDRSSPTILQNVISGNESETTAVCFYYGTSGTFHNNVVAPNVSVSSGGMLLAVVGDLTVYNNTFVANEITGTSAGSMGANLTFYGDSDAVALNNIFAWGEGGAGVGGSGGSTTAECGYNDFYSNDAGSVTNTAACAVGGTNLEVDPVFTSRSGDDYTLQASSTLLDAGDPDSAYNDVDGSRNQLGAYGGPDGSF